MIIVIQVGPYLHFGLPSIGEAETEVLDLCVNVALNTPKSTVALLIIIQLRKLPIKKVNTLELLYTAISQGNCCHRNSVRRRCCMSCLCSIAFY